MLRPDAKPAATYEEEEKNNRKDNHGGERINKACEEGDASEIVMALNSAAIRFSLILHATYVAHILQMCYPLQIMYTTSKYTLHSSRATSYTLLFPSTTVVPSFVPSRRERRCEPRCCRAHGTGTLFCP